MKYYIYLSESKVAMLYGQISASLGKSREASIGFDVKVIKGHIKETRGVPESSFQKLDEVISALSQSDLVGTIDDPKEYVGGCLQMSWCTFGNYANKSPITFWGYNEHDDNPFAGTVMALAGSKYHLLGEQREGTAHSHSGTLSMTRWFLENLEDRFENADETIEDAKKHYIDAPINDDDVAHSTWLAATQAGGQRANYEFVAKVLHKSEMAKEPFGDDTVRIILGSPLYVALAD